MYMVRYNTRKNFTANQKQFLYVPKFAEQIRDITSRQFFVNNCDIKGSEIEGGILERIAYESVMITYFIDKWNKSGNKNPSFINKNATVDQFEKLNNDISRLENIVSERAKTLFNARDSFIWFALFNKFTQTGLDDEEFGKFLNAFVGGLRNKPVDNQLFDSVDDTGSTKDKANIIAKLHIIETLMNEFLHINKEISGDVNIVDFVRENVSPDVSDGDVELYSEILDDIILEVDNNTKLLDEHNRPSLVALVGYACQNEIDDKLVEWIKEFFVKNFTYKLNQVENFTYMKNSLNNMAIA